MRAVLIWPDVGHYYAARSRALHEQSWLDIDTVEILGETNYDQFRARQSDIRTFIYLGHGLN